MTRMDGRGDDRDEVILPEEAAREFSTDTPVAVPAEEAGPSREDVLETAGPIGAAVAAEQSAAVPVDVAGADGSDSLSVLDRRPSAAAPREYHFPRFERQTLDNGMTVVTAHVPGRPLLTAQLIVRGDAGGGVTSEPAELGGITVLMARAMSEGTRRRNAVELIEAAERLGAELSADAGWDSIAAGIEVARSRLEPALALLAELALEPSFPEHEVERIREERINDLMQAKADPRRRSERLFPERVYAPGTPYRRPLAGIEETVSRIDRAAVAARHHELMRPGAATVLVAGDLTGLDIAERVSAAFADWPNTAAPIAAPPLDVKPRTGMARVLLVDRPGSPQSEVRVGHVGLPRRVPDFHALSVLNTILGGLFNSRLNRLLREERGYTYGVHSGFDFRRAAGPFAVRCAVQSEVTVPAIRDILGVLEGMREEAVTAEELAMARDYLVGVFPLRFETAGQVAAALGGLVVFELPDDELDRYRPAVAAVTADDVLTAARAHVRPDDACIVIVGDAAGFEADLRDAGLGEVEVVRESRQTAAAES
ncbi:MAG: zinc protease [Chloroflexota bacterium]|jgi:zinc protease|nr:zinc protease [Chloroflexota bacterium]